jgi:hypothetical protein
MSCGGSNADNDGPLQSDHRDAFFGRLGDSDGARFTGLRRFRPGVYAGSSVDDVPFWSGPFTGLQSLGLSHEIIHRTLPGRQM